MHEIIAILEDDPGRIQIMEKRLKESFPDCSAIFFNNAPDMITWLKSHLHECLLLSLDHDLGPSWERSGQLFDPGIGRDVVDYLITQSPECPVILHTSNSDAEIGMEMALKGANWHCERVIPSHSLEAIDSWDWIDSEWADTLKRLIQSRAKHSTHGNEERIPEKPQQSNPKTAPSSRMIIILDDTPEGQTLISDRLSDVFPGWSCGFFKNSLELMAWVSRHTPQFNRLSRAKSIVILENSKKRIERMRHHLEQKFPEEYVLFFDNAPELLSWLKCHLNKCLLISLDYNLGPSYTLQEKVFDPGNGREIVNYLATQQPQCPLIFHTSNKEAEIGMEMELIETPWIFERVTVTPDLKWIEKNWLPLVSLLLKPIEHTQLTASDIPSIHARWELFNHFALTFNGYESWESVEKCLEIGHRCAKDYQKKQILPQSFQELRTALLIARNRWRRCNMEPDDEGMSYIQAIAQRLRDKVHAHDQE
ncbi:MAG TPA: cyclic-phosphate processing receiver domain-containing protein [Vampirovibrionales bacterium]